MKVLQVPEDGIKGLIQNWKSDIVSGFSVFLIALPLCIGIALASGAPPMAGLFAGIVGGGIVSLISGSHVTINGPAAGLIAVVLNSINVLGGGDSKLGFELTLAAIVFAGALQVIVGLLKAGKLSAFFPTSVVHGMMAAIGIIIISKQFYVALGIQPAAKTIGGLIMEMPFSLVKLNPEVAVIGIVSILILVLLKYIKIDWVQKLPGPLVVVIIGMIIGLIFDLEDEHKYTFMDIQYYVGPKSLVNLPAHITDGFITPNFSKVMSWEFVLMTMTIMIVASIESILTASAIDKIDPYKRTSNMDRELIAKGLGNFVLGWIGGIPIIAEVVRSSANVNYGAKTRWSNFFHGVFLFHFIVFLPWLIHKIPLASLAGILIMVGVKLAAPREFAHTYEKGLDQLIIFLTTIIFTIVEDLLVGVAAGIIIQILIKIYLGLTIKAAITAEAHLNKESEDVYTLIIKRAIGYANFLKVQKLLATIPKGKTINIRLEEFDFVGYTAMEYLDEFQQSYQESGGTVIITGHEDFVPISSHPHAARTKKKK